MGKINIQSTDLSHKAGLTYTGTSDKTIDVNNVLQTSDTTASIASGKVVVDSSGNVGIGTNSPSYKLDIVNGRASITGNSDQYSLQLRYNSSTNGCWLGSPTTDSFAVYTAGGGERMRIDSSGNLLVGRNDTTIDSSHFGIGLFAGGSILLSRNVNGSSAVLQAYGNAGEFRIYGNGNAQNTNNSYGAISDKKLKENIIDASPKLEDICKVKVRNFNLIDDENKLKQIGVIAQELEEVFPSMVDETTDYDEVTKTRTIDIPAVLDEEGNELEPATTKEEEYIERVATGTTTKSVKYSVFVPMLIKAVQEQQAIIIDLTARIVALEAK